MDFPGPLGGDPARIRRRSRIAVSDADTLVAEVLQRLSTTFENQHQELEEQGRMVNLPPRFCAGHFGATTTFFDSLLAI
jgi:hypothetical protein